MSVFLDKADLVAARLNRVAGLESYHFLVARPRQLAAELERLTNRATGAGIVVWQGGPAESEAAPPRVASRYRIALLESPVLRRELPGQDEIAQLVIQAVHHWSPDSAGPNAFRTRFELVRVQPAEDSAGIDLFFESITQLPKPDLHFRP